MADDVLRIADGEFVFRIADPKVGNLQGPVLEISDSGALVSTRQRVDAANYETVLDVKIELKGQMTRQFFASIVGNEAEGLRLEWLDIDPGQQGRLKVLIDAYKARIATKQPAPAPAPSASSGESGHKTRRLVKPSSSTPAAPAPAPAPAAPPKPAMVFTPFGADPIPPPSPVVSAPPPAASTERNTAKRVIKPSAQALDLFGASAEPAPAPAPAAPAPAPAAQSPAQPKRMVFDPLPADDEASDGKKVVGQDGRMDIGATLRNKARTVSASELAARHDKVRVLNLQTIRQLILEAVEEAASHLSGALNEAERKRLLEEAEEGFQERMKAFQLEKASAEEKSKQLGDQLGKAQKLLDDERKRSISADQFTVSTAGLAEIEGAFLKVIDRCVVDGKLVGDVEAQLRALTATVLDQERQRIREKELSAHNDKIALLEKKIQRLAGNLEETERQRDEAREIASALEKSAGQGLSIDQIKQKFQIGLAKDDPRREQKLMVMRELLEQNRELRRKLGLATNQEAAAEADRKSAAIAQDVNNAAAAVMPPGDAPVVAGAEGFDEAATAEGDDAGPPPGNPDDEAWSPDADAPAADAAPAVNPDDLPWDAPTTTAPVADGEDERGVKVMRSFKKFEPPPLQPK